MNNTTNLSLQLLLLNDLFQTKAIDEEIYNKAKEKIVTIKKETKAA